MIKSLEMGLAMMTPNNSAAANRRCPCQLRLIYEIGLSGLQFRVTLSGGG
jgi:hypothetical protein